VPTSGVPPAQKASDGTTPTGRLEGTAFVGVHGHQSYTSGTKILASGPVNSETETNADGKFVFVALPPGTYTVDASFSGLEAMQTITVEANQVAKVSLQLKPARVKTSVDVTASSADAKIPAPTETITEKTIRDAPNLNERFDSLLPLVPGVVRGPEGHINLKARATRRAARSSIARMSQIRQPAVRLSTCRSMLCPQCRSYRILTIHNMASSPEPFRPVQTKIGSYQATISRFRMCFRAGETAAGIS
jgi:hypothetical protein